MQPLTTELVNPHVGDEVATRYGPFVIDDIVPLKIPPSSSSLSPARASVSSTTRELNLYHGRLINWRMGSHPTYGSKSTTSAYVTAINTPNSVAGGGSGRFYHSGNDGDTGAYPPTTILIPPSLPLPTPHTQHSS